MFSMVRMLCVLLVSICWVMCMFSVLVLVSVDGVVLLFVVSLWVLFCEVIKVCRCSVLVFDYCVNEVSGIWYELLRMCEIVCLVVMVSVVGLLCSGVRYVCMFV